MDVEDCQQRMERLQVFLEEQVLQAKKVVTGSNEEMSS
jgi:hypothetical protein